MLSEQVCEKEKSERDAELNKAFRVFDTDGDGFISLEEFTSALKVSKNIKQSLRMLN